MLKNKTKYFQALLFLLIIISLLLPLLNDDFFQYCFPVFLLSIITLAIISKNGLELFFSLLALIFFVVSLFVSGAFLYLFLFLFIIVAIAIVLKRYDIFKPSLNKILLFILLSSIFSFYIIKPSIYTEVPMNNIDVFTADEELEKEEQSFCLPLQCANSCYSILALENGKKKCRTCCNSIRMEDCEYRCKSIIPIAIIACLVFSYLISSMIVYFVSKYKYKKRKSN